jgi:hypothetical protein
MDEVWSRRFSRSAWRQHPKSPRSASVRRQGRTVTDIARTARYGGRFSGEHPCEVTRRIVPSRRRPAIRFAGVRHRGSFFHVGREAERLLTCTCADALSVPRPYATRSPHGRHTGRVLRWQSITTFLGAVFIALAVAGASSAGGLEPTTRPRRACGNRWPSGLIQL